MSEECRFDICIVGGGVAGAALAAYLGKGKLKIAVVEKTLAEQDRIIGELLQPGGVEMLKRMNLEHLLDGFDAQEIEGYALFMEGENFRVSYPNASPDHPHPLPPGAGEPPRTGTTGRGLRNGKFLMKMREYVFANPNVTVIEGTVLDMIEENGNVTGISYKPKGGDETLQLEATLTVVSDGIFSTLRSNLTNAEKKVNGHFMGLLLKDCVLPYPNHGHVIITEASPMLVYPVSHNETRVLIDFPGAEPPRKGEELTEYLKNTIGTQLPASIRPSFLAAVEEGKFKVMPNHQMAARPVVKNGVVLLGDSLNMRHPLTGGGMTVALTDVYLLGTCLLALDNFDKKIRVNEAVTQFYAARGDQSASINILADALYGVMRNKDLKQACFNYLKRGGNYAGEPVSILSAISRDVSLLIRHFFAVAVYGVRTLVFPLPTPSRVKRAYRMLADAVNIIWPLLRNEKMVGVPRVLAFFF